MNHCKRQDIFAEVHESALEFARGVGVKKCAGLWGGVGGHGVIVDVVEGITRVKDLMVIKICNNPGVVLQGKAFLETSGKGLISTYIMVGFTKVTMYCSHCCLPMFIDNNNHLIFIQGNHFSY